MNPKPSLVNQKKWLPLPEQVAVYHVMAESLPSILIDRLSLLQRLGSEVDAEAELWLADRTGSYDEKALNSIAEARRVIELTVDMAMAEHCGEHPMVLAMRKDWEQRFARIKVAMKDKYKGLADSLQQQTQQTRAVRAYMSTKGASF